MLLMKLPIRFGNGIRIEQPIGAGFRRTLRNSRPQPLSVDPAIDHNVCDMHTTWAVFPGGALRQGPQDCLGRRKGYVISVSQMMTSRYA